MRSLRVHGAVRVVQLIKPMYSNIVLGVSSYAFSVTSDDEGKRRGAFGVLERTTAAGPVGLSTNMIAAAQQRGHGGALSRGLPKSRAVSLQQLQKDHDIVFPCVRRDIPLFLASSSSLLVTLLDHKHTLS